MSAQFHRLAAEAAAAAATAAEIGVSRSAGAAERRSPGWVVDATEALAWAASEIGRPLFTIEELRQYIVAHAGGWLPEPPDKRAWGAATQMATRRGYIVRSSEYAPAASSNGSPKPLYSKGSWIV